MIPIEWSDEGRSQFVAAYAKAQAEMGKVEKDATNTHFSTKYSTLAAVISAVIPSMSANGLAVLQSPTFDGEVLTVETIVMHAEGGWIKSNINVRPGKPDAQGLGSAITYLRRYALMSLAGVAPEDDDGNAASVTGDGGKRFEQPKTFNKGANTVLEAFIAAMKLNKTVEDVDAWAKREANAIMEKLSKRDQDDMQAAYEAHRKSCEPAQTEAGDGDKPKTEGRPPAAAKSLADRAALFESAMHACAEIAPLQRVYEQGSKLRQELDKADPERMAELDALYLQLVAELERKPTAAELISEDQIPY
jgi:hypothetical protein